MMRIRSTFRYALPLALFLGATAVSTTTPAFADWQAVDSWTDSKGNTVTYWSDDKTDKVVISVDTGSKLYVLMSDKLIQAYMKWASKSDPGPEDSAQRIDKPDVADLLKKVKGLSIEIRQAPENTKLATWIDREGGGMIPHYNPGDQDTGSGRGNPPKHNEGGLTPKQKAEIVKLVNFAARTLGDIGGSMGGYGDASESAPGFNKSGSSGRSKGTSDGSGNSRDNQHKGAGEGEAATLGPRPDLVNPEPKNKTGASVLGGGLLDGGGVSGSGPAAVGSPLGTTGGGNSSATSSGTRAGGAGIR